MAKKKKKKDDELKKFEYSNEVLGFILILYIFINEFIITWRISNIKKKDA